MSHVKVLSVDRFRRVTRLCQYTSVEELGWFALTNQYEDPELKDYIADRNRRTLRKLSDQWDELRDFNLDDCWPFFEQHAQAFPTATGDWTPLFNMRSWMQDNQKAFNDFSPHIVSSGGHLKQIMDMPNSVIRIRDIARNAEIERLNYVACKRNGIIYLARYKFRDSTPAWKKAYRTHRFEQLVTRTSDGTKENPELGMTMFEYPYSVFGRTIGQTRLLYSQYIDCFDPHSGSAPSSYLNLHIVDHIVAPPNDKRFCSSWREQNQSRSTWTRCFLSGSSEALLGRQSDNQLVQCERIRAEDIRDKLHCPKQPQCWCHWSKERHIAFLNEFLEFVQATVVANYESSVYGFLVDYGHQNVLAIEAVEWKKGSAEFQSNNILRKWGGEKAWPVAKPPDFDETLKKTYASWKESKLL